MYGCIEVAKGYEHTSMNYSVNFIDSGNGSEYTTNGITKQITVS